jgi:hypothetical protein
MEDSVPNPIEERSTAYSGPDPPFLQCSVPHIFPQQVEWAIITGSKACSSSAMDFATCAGCAGITLALLVLPHLLFVVQIRGFVAEERRRRGEASAQMLRSLEDSLAERQHSPMKESPDTGHRHKLHKASVCKPSPRSSCSTDKHCDRAASQRPRASASTPGRAAANASHKQRPAVGIGSFDMRSSKLASGCSKGAGSMPVMSIVEARASTRFSTSCGTLPCPPQVASGQVACPAHATQHRRRSEGRRETMVESGRPKISVSSGSRFYGNVVEERAKQRRQIAPPTTPVGAASSHAERVVWMRRTPTA